MIHIKNKKEYSYTPPQPLKWVWYVLLGLAGGVILFFAITSAAPKADASFSKVWCHHFDKGDGNNQCTDGQYWWCPEHWEEGKCPTPTPTPTPTATPTPTPTPEPVCEQSEWSCNDCQTLNDDVCYKDQASFCSEEYGCDWQEVCPVGDLKSVECNREWVCKDTCEPEITPTPTPEPTVTPKEPEKPTGCVENCGVPACTDTVPAEVVNPHIYRQGDVALVKWYPKEGNKVNIYYKENSASDWQHSVQVDNTGYFEVKGLGTQDITFGLQSVNGCAADGVVTASNLSVIVDGNTSRWVLFK